MVSTETVEPLITDHTRLIIPVHFAGAAVRVYIYEIPTPYR